MRYCLGDPADTTNVWAALVFLPFGLFFDFMDGKVARWRKKSSMMGQELDSLADLVCGRSLAKTLLTPPSPPPTTLSLPLPPSVLFLSPLTKRHQISFGVAPACVALSLGLRSGLDHLALAFFVLCGLTRLARFNVTVAAIPKDATGKSSYFEGTPIPTTLAIDGIMALWVAKGWVGADLPLGVWGQGSLWEFHPVVLMFVLHGCLMTSKTIKIPKP